MNGDLIVLGIVVLCLGAAFLGMRKGRLQHLRLLSEVRAQGHAEGSAEAEASLMARLSQSVTVVAGNEYGRLHHQGDESLGIRDGLRSGIHAPGLAEGAGLDDELAVRVLLADLQRRTFAASRSPQCEQVTAQRLDELGAP